jgi:beta-barrel assembly-enhancing protease
MADLHFEMPWQNGTMYQQEPPVVFNSRSAATRAGLWFAGGIAAIAGAAYFTINFAPQQFARFLPDTWTQKMGDQLEVELVRGANTCTTHAGDAALSTLVERVTQGAPDLPPLRIRVYDIPVMNAWTLPGGHIVVTRGLIAKADTPDEVAGVLAHEMGHATHHDPEAQLVRITGVQILLGVVSGISGSNNGGSVAGLAAIMQSSQDAERAADAFAVATLTAANINPLGLKTFFEKMLAEDGNAPNGALGKLSNLFSTHPGTESRIKLIAPWPDGKTQKSILSDAQWQDLKHVCE